MSMFHFHFHALPYVWSAIIDVNKILKIYDGLFCWCIIIMTNDYNNLQSSTQGSILKYVPNFSR